MKVVITYGTFDVFHVGHLRLLKRAKMLGDYLIVALSTDEFNLTSKNKTAAISYEDRFEILNSIKYVDKVIAEESWNQKISDIKKYDVDVFVIGDDWRGEFDFLKESCDVCYLPRTENVSSTEIKMNIKAEF
ncbi:MAG: glycerol-3-phosphate cytidylyltransferase [Ferrimonas sp.]